MPGYRGTITRTLGQIKNIFGGDIAIYWWKCYTCQNNTAATDDTCSTCHDTRAEGDIALNGQGQAIGVFVDTDNILMTQ
jgi:hypothetical protein